MASTARCLSGERDGDERRRWGAAGNSGAPINAVRRDEHLVATRVVAAAVGVQRELLERLRGQHVHSEVLAVDLGRARGPTTIGHAIERVGGWVAGGRAASDPAGRAIT